MGGGGRSKSGVGGGVNRSGRSKSWGGQWLSDMSDRWRLLEEQVGRRACPKSWIIVGGRSIGSVVGVVEWRSDGAAAAAKQPSYTGQVVSARAAR
jgi:hypothetical protein